MLSDLTCADIAFLLFIVFELALSNWLAQTAKRGLPYVRFSPDTSSFLAFVRTYGWVFENRRFVRVFGPIRGYIRTLPIAKAYDGMRRRKLVSFQYKMSVTSQNAILVERSNSVVNYKDIFSVKFCAQCEYSKTCKPICVICIWFCIVSIDLRLVIFAYLQVCEEVSSFSTQTIW